MSGQATRARRIAPKIQEIETEKTMEGEEYEAPLSIHECRRRAPLHFLAKADNARIAARVLWDAAAGDHDGIVAAIGYGGTPHVALHEAFLREASLAIELILKGLVAQRLEMGVSKLPNLRPSNTHDLLRLWDDAELEKPAREDHQTLFIARKVLQWAGRYAAPTKDTYFDSQAEEEESLRDYEPNMSVNVLKTRSISWEQFDAVYALPSAAFWELRNQPDPATT